MNRRNANAMDQIGRLWSKLLHILVVELTAVEARRVTNILLASSISNAGLDGRVPSFADVETISKVLGKPVALQPDLLISCWDVLSSVRETLAHGSDTNWQLDSWIEAFQASDPSRKALGAYATPTVFADALAEIALTQGESWPLKRIIDPAAGTGALLLAAHRRLVSMGLQGRTASLCLYGIEIDPAARELCILLLWTAGGGDLPLLEALSTRIECKDALQVPWEERESFDVLLMNPPWESLRHLRSDPDMAQARARALHRLEHSQPLDPSLPPLFSSQGRGDRNLAKMFIELAPHLLRPGGRLGAVLPAAFGSDDGMADLRRLLFKCMALDRWTTFENIQRHFNIDSRYKFGLLSGIRSVDGTTALDVRAFCSDPSETKSRHVRLEGAQIAHIGGPDYMIPEVVSASERDAIACALSCGTAFFDGGALGAVEYRREVDLTLGRERKKFWHVDEMPPSDSKELRTEILRDLVPVMEGRMVGQYDCFQKSWVEGSARRAVWRFNSDLPLSRCRPQYLSYRRSQHPYRLAICDVTSATNARTVHATLVPEGWLCGNTAPVLEFESEVAAYAALAVLNSMAFDWIARRIVGGLHLNKFYFARMAWPYLNAADVTRLADCARRIAAAHPRGLPYSTGECGYIPPVMDMVLVEKIVLNGFGMSKEMRSVVYTEDRSDRRGFWRYFEGSALGLQVARLTLDQNASTLIAAE